MMKLSLKIACFLSLSFVVVITLFSIYYYIENDLMLVDQHYLFNEYQENHLRQCYPLSNDEIITKIIQQKQYKKENDNTVLTVLSQTRRRQSNHHRHNRNDDNNEVTIKIPRYYHLADFLEGPGLEKYQTTLQNNRNHTNDSLEAATAAACKYVIHDTTDSYSTSGIMQQLYRCFSWWYVNPEKDYYLIGLPKKKKFTHPNNKFILGFIESLHDVFHVSTVLYRNRLPVVRPIIPSYNISAVINDIIINEKKDKTNNSTTESSNLLRNNYNSGYQMANRGDAKYLRDTVLQYYFRSTSFAKCNPNTKTPRITILNRNAGSGRHIVQVEKIQQELLRSFFHHTKKQTNETDDTTKQRHQRQQQQEDTYNNNNHVRIIDNFDTSYSFRQQIDILSSTDILISSHGDQLIGIPFLADCANVIEIFPYGYYYPEFYASLASISGLYYDSYYTGMGNTMMTSPSPTTTTGQANSTTSVHENVNELLLYMKDDVSRSVALSFDICLDVHHLITMVKQRIEQWKECCATYDSTSTAMHPNEEENNEQLQPHHQSAIHIIRNKNSN